MGRKAITIGLFAAVAAAVLAPAAFAHHAGSIKLSGPRGFVRGAVPVAWSHRPGRAVRHDSTMTLALAARGRSVVVAEDLPVHEGTFSWNTTRVADGAYSLVASVDGTRIRSAVPVTVDNAAPKVAITRPRSGDVVLDDAVVGTAPATVVFGKTTMTAQATDETSGVASVVWALDGAEIGRGTTAVYDFTQTPGRHTLTATATDRAGNRSDASLEVVAGPATAEARGKVPSAPPSAPKANGPSLPAAPQPPAAPAVPAVPLPGVDPVNPQQALLDALAPTPTGAPAATAVGALNGALYDAVRTATGRPPCDVGNPAACRPPAP